jgi:hypothetical protein
MVTELERLVLRLESFERQVGYLKGENQLLKGSNGKLEQTIAKQGQELLKLRELVEKVAKENERLAKKNEKLLDELRKYRNENTPSGALPPYLKDELARIVKDSEEPPPDTKSAKPNCRNKRPKPERTETHSLDKCPKCKHPLRKLKKVHKRIIIHLSLPETEAVLHKSSTYFCDHCGEAVVAPIPEVLPNSKFDLNICLLVLLLNAIGTTQRKTGEILGWFGVFMCPASANNIICRMQELLGRRKYLELEQDIRRSLFGGMDETTHRHHGKTFYIQAVATMRTAFFRIFDSRSYACVKKLPSPMRGGTSDGTRAYDKILKAIQRCWAHLLRKIKYPERTFDEQWEIDQFVSFAESMGKLFHEAKHEKRRGVSVRKEYDTKLKDIALSTYKKEGNLVEVLNYILSYEGEWFTFLQYRGMEPTNNRVERALRPLVIRRKVSQHTWSEEGREALAVVQSLYQTCKLRGESFPELIRHEIEHNLNEIGKS